MSKAPTKAKVPAKTPAKAPAKTAAKTTATSTKAPAAAPEVKSPPQPQPPKEIDLKGSVRLFFDRKDEDLNKADRWPLLIDPTERFSTFARHRDTRYVECYTKEGVEPNRVRLAVLSAYFFGTTLVIDFMDNLELLKRFEEVCDTIDAKLYQDLINKEIDENRYKDFIRDEDGDEYLEWKIRNKGDQFNVLFLTTKPEVADLLPYTIPYIMT